VRSSSIAACRINMSINFYRYRTIQQSCRGYPHDCGSPQSLSEAHRQCAGNRPRRGQGRCASGVPVRTRAATASKASTLAPACCARLLIRCQLCRAFFVIVHGVWATPDSWVRKRLACPTGGTQPPPPNPSPRWGEDRWGALNDYK
jgi:hypothetical protein